MSIKTAVLNGVASIELARVQKKNALDSQMYSDMTQALQSALNDTQVRAVLIYGQPDVFSMGGDLEDLANPEYMAEKSPLRVFMHALSHFEKPVIAAVNGPAIGIGTALLLHCDMVYAADTAHFALPFVSLGLVPEFGSSYLVPRLIGRRKACEKLLLAQPFNAQEAMDMGLVNAVLPETEVVNYARSIAERFNKLPPAAVRATKHLVHASFQQEVDVAIEAEAAAFAKQAGSDEVKEVLSAFLEKRWPDFTKF